MQCPSSNLELKRKFTPIYYCLIHIIWIIIFLLNQMSHNNTSNGLLNINFNLKKGLILKWNFIGQLSKGNYYRHLLIIDTEDVSKAQNFMRLYYKKIRIGDLFGVKKTFKNKISKSFKWKQKNLLEAPNFDSIYCAPFQYDQLADALFEAAKFIQNDDGHWPMIVSILTDKKAQGKISQLIGEIRKERNSFNFIVNVFGQFKNSINFRTGVNFFELSLNHRQDVLEFYKNYIYRIEFYFVQIHIQCENGSISCQKSSQWPNTALNRITKKFYGPHMDYEQDVLFFLNQQNYGQLDLLLHVSLEYITLEGRKFKSNKRISLTSFDNQIQSRTLGINDNIHELEMYRNVWFQKYPFKSQFFVWFNKDKDNTLKQSLKKQHETY